MFPTQHFNTSTYIQLKKQAQLFKLVYTYYDNDQHDIRVETSDENYPKRAGTNNVLSN